MRRRFPSQRCNTGMDVLIEWRRSILDRGTVFDWMHVQKLPHLNAGYVITSAQGENK